MLSKGEETCSLSTICKASRKIFSLLPINSLSLFSDGLGVLSLCT